MKRAQLRRRLTREDRAPDDVVTKTDPVAVCLDKANFFRTLDLLVQLSSADPSDAEQVVLADDSPRTEALASSCATPGRNDPREANRAATRSER